MILLRERLDENFVEHLPKPNGDLFLVAVKIGAACPHVGRCGSGCRWNPEPAQYAAAKGSGIEIAELFGGTKRNELGGCGE
jgi:hypothetical protein